MLPAKPFHVYSYYASSCPSQYGSSGVASLAICSRENPPVTKFSPTTLRATFCAQTVQNILYGDMVVDNIKPTLPYYYGQGCSFNGAKDSHIARRTERIALWYGNCSQKPGKKVPHSVAQNVANRRDMTADYIIAELQICFAENGALEGRLGGRTAGQSPVVGVTWSTTAQHGNKVVSI